MSMFKFHGFRNGAAYVSDGHPAEAHSQASRRNELLKSALAASPMAQGDLQHEPNSDIGDLTVKDILEAEERLEKANAARGPVPLFTSDDAMRIRNALGDAYKAQRQPNTGTAGSNRVRFNDDDGAYSDRYVKRDPYDTGRMVKPGDVLELRHQDFGGEGVAVTCRTVCAGGKWQYRDGEAVRPMARNGGPLIADDGRLHEDLDRWEIRRAKSAEPPPPPKTARQVMLEAVEAEAKNPPEGCSRERFVAEMVNGVGDHYARNVSAFCYSETLEVVGCVANDIREQHAARWRKFRGA